ncbi:MULTISPECIES: hypothetical protein [unclassified Streptomyces]|uniref:hypothetical protein n=1 Tax=unclassified Streptomyces TaxID=2593676 RepID=UPI002F90F55E|nr:hypothetical protein OG509_42075 [Streptomyces sp. NBC_01006]
MKIGLKSWAGAMAGAALLGAVSVIPAHAGVTAEGQFESSINSWRAGNESRRWWDNNDTGDYTGIYFSGCYADGGGGFNYAGLQLWKDISSAPDRSKGTRTNYCGWVDYGDPNDAGNYYFALTDVSHGSFISVDYVKVAW